MCIYVPHLAIAVCSYRPLTKTGKTGQFGEHVRMFLIFLECVTKKH